MKGRFLASLLVVLVPSTVFGDVTVRVHEGGVRDGKPWGETYTESFSRQGLRIDVTSDGSRSPSMYFLYLRNPDRLFIVQGASVTAVDRPTLEALEAKRGALAPPTEHLTAIGSSHSVNGFSCSGFLLRRKGLPTRYACLASAQSLGLPPDYIEAARDLRDMLSRVMAAAASSSAAKKTPPFNFYGLSEGYPVRMWQSEKGEVTWENQLVSVTQGDVSPDLFRAPNPTR